MRSATRSLISKVKLPRFMHDAPLRVVARGAIGTLFVQVGGTGLSFLLSIMLARLMGVHDYGTYVYVIAWVNVLSLISMLGLQSGALKFLPGYWVATQFSEAKGYIARAFQLIFAVSAAVGVATALVASGLHKSDTAALLWAFIVGAVLLLISSLASITQAILQSLHRVVRAIVPLTVFRPVLMAAIAAGLYLGFRKLDAVQALWAYTAATFFGFLILGHWARKLLTGKWQKVTASYRTRQWLGYSLSMLLMGGVTIILNQADLLLIGGMLGTSQAGIYGAAVKLANLVAFALTANNVAVAPMISQLHSVRDHAGLQRVVTMVAWAISLFALVIGLILWTLGPLLLGFYGAEFRQGYGALVLLVGGQLVNSFCGPAGYLVTMTGHHRAALAITALSAAINLVGNIFLIPVFGIMGAALSTAATMVLWNLIMSVYAFKRLGINSTVFRPLNTHRHVVG